MDERRSRWASSYYRARPTRGEAAQALRDSPDDLAHWENYCTVMGQDPDLELLREGMTRAAAWQESRRIDVALGVLDMLGFSRHSPLPRIHLLFEKIAKPWLEWAFDSGHHDLGLHLEGRIYNDYVKADETEIHARRTYEQLLPSITRAAKARATGPTISPAGHAPAGAPRVGYFLHTPSTLAHAETLLNMLALLRANPLPRFEPIVYLFQGVDAAFDARIQALGIPTVRLDQCEGGQDPRRVVARFEILRRHLRRERVRTLVWMSALPWLAFIATMGLGVKLAWYSQKYHVLRVPGIDGYLTNGDGEMREIQGQPWQTIRLSGRWFDPHLTAEARMARARLGAHRLTIGTLVREEKMAEPAFVHAVARLLREHPDVLYLWAGRAQPPEVMRIFESHGVLARQRFLGWVNTRMASQMIDVYLDSFPAPGGFTAREAMAAGAAMVFFKSREADETGPGGFIGSLLAGEGRAEDVSAARAIMGCGSESLFLRAETPGEYLRHARRLLGDDAFRAKAGAANRAMIAAFYEDDSRMLESHARAVLAV